MRLADQESTIRKWMALTIGVILLDQLTKIVAEASLNLGTSINVLPSFNFTLAYNTGAAWSFLSQAGGWQRWFFVGLSAVISVLIFFWIRQLSREEKLTAFSLSLILGGAVGNLIDRLLYGHVIDFIHVYYQSFHWPVFNIADSAITVGAILLAYTSLRGERVHHG